MKKYLFIFVLLLFVKSGWSQNQNLDYKYALKIYNLSSLDEYERSIKTSDTSLSHLNYTTTTLQILHPTIAFQWKTKKNNFHELELTSFVLGKISTKTENTADTNGISQAINDYDQKTTLISVRYEYILNFNKNKDKKLVPSIGFAVNPYYRENNYLPKISSSFSTSENFFGARVFVTPRLTYYLNSKLFFDINIPICFFDSYLLIDEENNPALPEMQRTTSTYNFNGLSKVYSGRIGVGLKL